MASAGGVQRARSIPMWPMVVGAAMLAGSVILLRIFERGSLPLVPAGRLAPVDGGVQHARAARRKGIRQQFPPARRADQGDRASGHALELWQREQAFAVEARGGSSRSDAAARERGARGGAGREACGAGARTPARIETKRETDGGGTREDHRVRTRVQRLRREQSPIGFFSL